LGFGLAMISIGLIWFKAELNYCIYVYNILMYVKQKMNGSLKPDNGYYVNFSIFKRKSEISAEYHLVSGL